LRGLFGLRLDDRLGLMQGLHASVGHGFNLDSKPPGFALLGLEHGLGCRSRPYF
jgi:hypothetical protein